MKRDYLKSIGLTDEQINLVMEQNGNDINSAKVGLQAEVEKYKGEAESNLAKATDWEGKFNAQAAAYKDYDILKQFHTDAMAKQTKERQIDYVKGLGVNHPELIANQIDFSKATYDEEKKTYTGLDEQIKGLKQSYPDMFGGTQQVNPQPQPSVNPNGGFLEKAMQDDPSLKDYLPRKE